MSGDRVLIVGAGIAGLSLAIMLAERNIESLVLESRQRFDGPTSGVRISVEGVRVLQCMRVHSIGEETTNVNLRFGRISASFSAPKDDVSAIIVSRLAVHEKLLERALSLGISIVMGFRVVAVNEWAGGVGVTSQSNERVTGTILVGADGVGSTLRQMLNPGHNSAKTYAGYLGVGLLTEHEAKMEMTLHSYSGHQVGIASCGKVNEAAPKKSIFIWTHIRMSEQDARLATQEGVEAQLDKRAEGWSPELRGKYELYKNDDGAVLAYGPIYNGTPPDHWYSKRMILIGDAAHPYGPGGQGISMALKDAKALCQILMCGFTEGDRKEFQRSRADEARSFGEAAEKRNAKIRTSRWSLFAAGAGMKAMEMLTGGRMTF